MKSNYRGTVLSKSEQEVEYRELRWADVPSYMKLMPQAPGEFERSTGLDQTMDLLFQYFHRRSFWTLYAFIRAMRRAPLNIFVGVSEGRVLGTASLTYFAKAGYVMAVVTDSAVRNRGVASHILEQVHLAAKGRGMKWLALDVESDNDAALRVYKRLGYEERVRFAWHVGPTPAAGTHRAGAATEVPRQKMEEVASWVSLHQLPAIHEPLPAAGKMLSHFENFSMLPKTQVKTWMLCSSGQTMAVARGAYIPSIHTGFVIPSAWDSAISGDTLLALLTPIIDWIRSAGGTRTAVPVPDPPGVWESAMASLGLPKGISTTLMVRPCA